MSELKDACGVAAVCRRDGQPLAAHVIPDMLLDIQNRGQLSAGLTSYQAGRSQLIDTYKDVGPVSEVFKLSQRAEAESILSRYAGSSAIGHVRYATCGADDPSYAQPFERHHGRRWKWFSFCFNGNLANYRQLEQTLMRRANYHIVREGDTEVFMHYLAYELRGNRQRSLVDIFSKLSRRIDGAYSMAFLNGMGELAVVRDPLGFRPLCYSQTQDWFMAASESVAISNQGLLDVNPLPPGSVALVREDGTVKIEQYAEPKRTAHCFFEWVYFANAGSTIEGQSVYLARTRLGQALARQEFVDTRDAIVVPVPDTAKAAADAMAYALGIPSREGLLRNRYVGRTFIESNDRAAKAKRKYTPLREVLDGRKVILVEDSLVRGTTLQAIIGHMREWGGAKEIHVRLTCPPIVAPCCYGIDMSSIGELYAPRFLPKPMEGLLPRRITNRMAKDVGADSLMYLPVEAIPECIGLDRSRLCMACLTGDYPTPWGKRLYRTARSLHKQGRKGRVYEYDKT